MDQVALLSSAIILLAIALVLFWQARRSRKSSGLPAGQVISSDMQSWKFQQEPLYHPELGLVGRPDYLVKQGNEVIPVEVKTTADPGVPFDSHIYQLAAYCLLVERVHRKRPPYGILHYPHRTYKIEYTAELETALLSLLDGMRQQESQRMLHRSHEVTNRCQRCSYRSICDQKLG